MSHAQLSLHDLSELVVMQVQRGRSRAEIVQYLIQRGWPEVSAKRFVDTTLSEHEELRAQPPDNNQGEGHPNDNFVSQQELWRMLWVVALAVAVIVLFGLLY